MSVPDRFRGHLPQPIPLHPTKKMTRAEQAAQLEIWHAELQNFTDVEKAAIEMEANAEIVGGALDSEIDFYDTRLPKVGNSRIKQEDLLERKAFLKALDDNTIIRHRR